MQEVVRAVRASSAFGPSGVFYKVYKYIDTSVQKGGSPGMPGCLEHTGVVTQLIKEAHQGEGDQVVL